MDSAASRPSRIAQTTRLAPRTMSPAANTPSRLVINVRGSAVIVPQRVVRSSGAPNSAAISLLRWASVPSRTHDAIQPFSALVAPARSMGYTEPDPRDDLSGTDVARKLVILAREANSGRVEGPAMTSLVFEVKNVPAALFKALGGFATNGVNMTKLESYMVDGIFTATQFYADVEGHPEDPALQRALDELRYFTSSLDILGVYPADPLRAFGAAPSMVPSASTP